MQKIIDINVQEPAATLIKEGRKTIEGILQKGKFLEVEVGDILILNEETKLEIIRLGKYKSFKEMLENEGFENAVPLARNIDEAVEAYYKFYSKEDEEEFGVLAIEIKLT